jgi:hypothetical protein
MPLTALELVNRSFYDSQIVGKNFNTATNDQVKDGIFYLNNLLAEKSADQSLNPYYKLYDFNAVAGQEEYFIENLINIETLTFVWQTVRYPSQEYSRVPYFGNFRANTVTTLPLTWHLEREYGGARIFLYPLPNEAYEFKLSGQFGLTQVSATTDLWTVYDRFYTDYLEKDLARTLCMVYGKDVPPYLDAAVKRCEKTLSNQISAPDLSTVKTSTLSCGGSINYAFVNLSNGWTVPSGG